MHENTTAEMFCSDHGIFLFFLFVGAIRLHFWHDIVVFGHIQHLFKFQVNMWAHSQVRHLNMCSCWNSSLGTSPYILVIHVVSLYIYVADYCSSYSFFCLFVCFFFTVSLCVQLIMSAGNTLLCYSFVCYCIPTWLWSKLGVHNYRTEHSSVE